MNHLVSLEAVRNFWIQFISIFLVSMDYTEIRFFLEEGTCRININMHFDLAVRADRLFCHIQRLANNRRRLTADKKLIPVLILYLGMACRVNGMNFVIFR